ncbi:type VI secretion system baseplate subunit TssF [uncultured Tateyamaria sp.]|uniref:type VI secretion system baseplate subunit TssF n=1 Tax=uncultured Tateyamaria sp. TaxID=455651 RepID=UPI002622F1A3|nr:type VI secretion system baseplate subunit TssF [uncultured Tateyamaria sp.]
MDATFLSYYEDELTHIRDLAKEFAQLHPAVARNLSLDSVPCPDPYVERLLEGVAYLSARTRLKVDAESSRYVQALLDALYPDLVAPAPAMSLVKLAPGDQVEEMVTGYTVPRGTSMVSGLRDGLATRACYTTAQDVTLWPIKIEAAEYLQDIGALQAVGLGDDLDGARHAAGIKLQLCSASTIPLSQIEIDQLDLYLGHQARGGLLFDAIHGHSTTLMARGKSGGFSQAGQVEMIGMALSETLLPPVSESFQGYSLLREYFLMPERFNYVRLTGLQSFVKKSDDSVEIIILLDKQQPDLADISVKDFQLFVTPIVNLFERECNIVELDRARTAHLVHADRTRTMDFEIFRLLSVEDVETDGPQAAIPSSFAATSDKGSRLSYATKRRARRPVEDEIRRGQMRTSYPGDDFYIALSHDGSATGRNVGRLDIRALCTNRDLPILDDTPVLTLETGAPVNDITLLQAIKRPRASLQATLPSASARETRRDEVAWRWISQMALNQVSLTETYTDAEPIRALLSLYADRGDPALKRHAQALRSISAKPIMERLPIAGPMCFGQGTEIGLSLDETVLAGHSRLLMSAILAQLFRRHAAINAVVRTKTTLIGSQEDVSWPLSLGNRAMI